MELHIKTASGEKAGGGVFSGAQVEISGTAQPGFFWFLCFNSLLYHRNVSRNVTPLSPDCSLIILSNEKRRKRGEYERGGAREREKCMRIAILSYSLLHTGCITTSLKKILTAQ